MVDLKKYTQISLFLLFFITLIVIKNYVGSDDDNLAVVGPRITVTPVSTQTPALSPVVSSQPMDTSVPTTIPTVTPTHTPVPTPQGQYKDGTYTGSVEDAYYGDYQVQAVISGGKLTDVVFLQYPNDNRTSIRINTQASVYLKQEAISAQSASVDIISGASDSSLAFRKSMATALKLAKR